MLSRKKINIHSLLLTTLLLLSLTGCSGVNPKENEKNLSPLPTLAEKPGPTTSPDSVSPTEAISAPQTITPSVTNPVELTPVITLQPTVTPVPEKKGTSGEVSFSEAGSFLSEDTMISLSLTKKKDGFITYTTDGRNPSETSMRYTEPLLLAAPEDTPQVTVLRAKAFYTDGTESNTYVHTYFSGKNVNSRYTTLVFSVNGDPDVLTEGPDGILYGENYKERGDSSEREIHIEALRPDGTLLFSQFAGARVYGGTSREHAVKSLKLYARKAYEEGKGNFAFSEFNAKTADGKSTIVKYDKLVLRNGGDDFQASFLRDELLQRLTASAGMPNHEAVLPALMYLNGEYYGFYWLHESYCDKYFQNRNGKSDGEYVILEGSDSRKSYGDDAFETAAAKEINALYADFSKQNLQINDNYLALCEKIDVENYLDYMSYNMYAANYDWPQGNFRCFRYYAAPDEEYGTGEMDGRWRFLPHDMDIGFGTYQSSSDAGAIRNDLKEVLVSGGKRYSPLLAALLKREDCKQYFIDRMMFYMNGPLSLSSVSNMLKEMQKERDTELMLYIKHLQSLPDDAEIYATEKQTEKHITRILTFAEKRPSYMKSYLESFFSISLPE